LIVVKLELHSAVTNKITLLGKLVIANDGTGSRTSSHYDAQFIHKDGTIGKTVRIERHRRLAYSVWTLVKKVLNEARY
jgi:hypothetical protein